MSGYRIGMAEEAVIADLTAKLAECQAREAKLQEEIERLHLYKNLADEYGLQVFPDFATLNEALLSAQAREAKLREVLNKFVDTYGKDDVRAWMRVLNSAQHAIALPHDDTALKEYRKKVLDNYLEVMRNVFEEQGMDWPLFETLTTELRRMAEG